MNFPWFYHILIIAVILTFLLFIKLNKELSKWGRGFWFVLLLSDLYLYGRTIFAQWFPVSGSWDVLVYGVFFAFASYALLTAMVTTGLYMMYKRKQRNKR